jgi:gluconokinase
MRTLVFMGVSGCGKSSAAAGVAARLGWTLIEGDDFHPAANLQKMQSGHALNDEDRAGWLLKLQTMLGQHTEGVVMTCSALKRRYRDQLRLGARDLGFVFMDLTPELARQRVLARGATHFMPATLIDSQFADLESPVGENGVLRVDATQPLHEIVDAVVQWIESQ